MPNNETNHEFESAPHIYKYVRRTLKGTTETKIVEIVYGDHVETYELIHNHTLSQINTEHERTKEDAYKSLFEVYDDDYYSGNGYRKIGSSKTVFVDKCPDPSAHKPQRKVIDCGSCGNSYTESEKKGLCQACWEDATACETCGQSNAHEVVSR